MCYQNLCFQSLESHFCLFSPYPLQPIICISKSIKALACECSFRPLYAFIVLLYMVSMKKNFLWGNEPPTTPVMRVGARGPRNTHLKVIHYFLCPSVMWCSHVMGQQWRQPGHRPLLRPLLFLFFGVRMVMMASSNTAFKPCWVNAEHSA